MTRTSVRPCSDAGESGPGGAGGLLRIATRISGWPGWRTIYFLSLYLSLSLSLSLSLPLSLFLSFAPPHLFPSLSLSDSLFAGGAVPHREPGRGAGGAAAAPLDDRVQGACACARESGRDDSAGVRLPAQIAIASGRLWVTDHDDAGW